MCVKSVCHHGHIDEVNQNTKECLLCFLYLSFLYRFPPYISLLLLNLAPRTMNRLPSLGTPYGKCRLNIFEMLHLVDNTFPLSFPSPLRTSFPFTFTTTLLATVAMVYRPKL